MDGLGFLKPGSMLFGATDFPVLLYIAHYGETGIKKL